MNRSRPDLSAESKQGNSLHSFQSHTFVPLTACCLPEKHMNARPESFHRQNVLSAYYVLALGLQGKDATTTTTTEEVPTITGKRGGTGLEWRGRNGPSE